ncbi:3Beta-HSD domain-containing protein [Mycena indigotica]|uniref:3Beta-HSD domain-containing protein n=1 Tax=Mycena indigotica TaxID=2126181 RepID=A0A8H6SQS5_9AGAR|nr:3Beta-HSD domain-containing protein [Mycena indigotica]KAF7303709.1 3Beta-HSD domain-containing protein [Mycena indigotica]
MILGFKFGLLFLILFLWRVATRLRRSPTSNVSRLKAHPLPTKEELEAVSYSDIDLLATIPPATHSRYVVIGGSGFLGTYIVRLLIMRGETNIQILDVNPPPVAIGNDPSVSFIKTDITSLDSLRQAMPAEHNSPTVIFHVAATIRFWERAEYCFSASHHINVLGTKNVLQLAQELSNSMMIYTSSIDTVLPMPKFLRADWDVFPAIIDDDTPVPTHIHEGCYARSKRMAEQLVVEASINQGLKTGILRPGGTILGPNDRLVSSTLTMSQVPIWDEPWTGIHICAWDAAAAHLLLEDALNCIPEQVSGQGFAITGRGPPWSMENIRKVIQHYATRDLTFITIPPLWIYLMAHIMESFLFLRYFILLPLASMMGQKPSLTPRWLGAAVFLQPSTLDVQLIDVAIDDSRARKLLRYRPQWDILQAIRYSVDEIQSGTVAAEHGLRVY